MSIMEKTPKDQYTNPEIRIVMPDEEIMRGLYEASKIGSIEILKTLIQDYPNILHQVLLSSSINTENPLHISVSCGHLEFTQFLLDQKPELAGEVDSHQRTPLHLASANGEIEIVRELLEKNIHVCLVRDLNGMIPLHYAVIRGKIEIIEELIKARPQSVWTKLANDQTVFHLCVKSNHLEALKLLTERSLIHDKEFLNATDDSGNTILDLSLMLRQVEIARYLLSIPDIKTGTTSIVANFATSSNPAGVQQTENVQNIRETPKSHRPAETKTRGWWEVWKQRTKYKGDWEEEVQSTMMLVATVIATMTFQGSINPPGGVWQQDTPYNETSLSRWVYEANNNTIFLAGTAVMAYRRSRVYSFYSLANTISFVASVSVILLIISGFPLRNRIGGWILRIAMCVAVLFLMMAYLLGTSMVSFRNGGGLDNANIITMISLLGMIELVGLWYVISCLIWMWKRVFSKFTSGFSTRLVYKRLCFCVYVFVCVLFVGGCFLLFFFFFSSFNSNLELDLYSK